MPDKGHMETEALLRALEKRIAAEYRKANREITRKVNAYMSEFKRKDKEWRKKLENEEITEAEYKAWQTGQVMIGKRWEEMRHTLAQDYANTNDIARQMAFDSMPEVYALNHNYATFEAEKGGKVDTSYTLYDRPTVERLIRDDPKLLPDPRPGSPLAQKLAKHKELRWEEQHVQSAVLQSILQGESLDKTIDRFKQLTEMNHRQAVRYARTATTGAQNAGRVDGYKRAEKLGVDMKQIWLSTLDDRTRHEHRVLDGQEVDVGEPFEVDGYKIKYPGDPAAPAHLLYNCRCTVIAKVKGVDYDVSDKTQRDDKIGDMTYEEWGKQHQSQNSKDKKSSYYKPIEIKPSERIPQETINKVNQRFKELDNKYHAKVENVNDLLVQQQYYWDRDYTNYVEYLQDEQGYTKRKAENRAKQTLGERPEKVAILQGGEYNMEEHILSLNSNGVYARSSFAEDIEAKRQWKEKNTERQAEGKRARHRGNVSDSFEGAFIHEYGHAIDATYNVHENPKFKELYRRYSESDVDMGVSLYATENELEFIAECFADSFMGEEQGEISKEFMKILEEIINDST